jgi:hypothetical protein
MTNREILIEALTQTIAPRLFKLSGDKPDEMGFPIYDTPEEVDDHLSRQFDPVAYWSNKAREIATSLVNIVEAGGVDTSEFAYNKAVDAARKERPDLDEAA